MNTLPQTLNQAVQYHRAGNLFQAEQMYRQILQVDPRHFDALMLLAMIAHQMGRHDLSIDYLRQALHIKPDDAKTHLNLGIVCRAAGKPADALASYQQAHRLDPGNPDRWSPFGDGGMSLRVAC